MGQSIKELFPCVRSSMNISRLPLKTLFFSIISCQPYSNMHALIGDHCIEGGIVLN